jgi:hypothetical protein
MMLRNTVAFSRFKASAPKNNNKGLNIDTLASPLDCNHNRAHMDKKQVIICFLTVDLSYWSTTKELRARI